MLKEDPFEDVIDIRSSSPSSTISFSSPPSSPSCSNGEFVVCAVSLHMRGNLK